MFGARPRLTHEEKERREKEKQTKMWQCKGCNRVLSRSQWYKHRSDGCSQQLVGQPVAREYLCFARPRLRLLILFKKTN